MSTEIYWSPEVEDGTELIPGHVTRVFQAGREVRIFFAGQEGTYGGKFEGVLRLRLGAQEIKGAQSYKYADQEWEPDPFTVRGQFQSRRFDNFSGIWTEKGARCLVEVVGIPSFKKAVATRKRAKKVRNPSKRRSSR